VLLTGSPKEDIHFELEHYQKFHNFRKLAKQRLPEPVFDYIDGAAEN